MNKNIDDIIISSRVRLARNIEGLPFKNKLNPKSARSLVHDVYSALGQNDKYFLYRIAEMTASDGALLKEKHLISDDLLHNRESGAAIINECETVSIMINEEDHLRQQCILSGLSLREAFEEINAIDDRIGSRIPFSFSPKLGFLTACPTNLGTGMRASALLFLPGLTIYNSLESCVNAVSRLNMTIRGVYGEGSDASGCMFQVSNQKSLGYSEQQIIDSVQSAISQIVDAELRARDALLKRGVTELKDTILRAYGTLTCAYKIDSREFMQLIALVRLGIYYGFIIENQKGRMDKLITGAQPAGILSLASKPLSETERDIMRASYVSKTLSSFTKRA